MAHRKKPHPRSLDALFPRPKKPPVRLCPKGHRQWVNWKPGHLCTVCHMDEVKRLEALGAAAEREEWSRKHRVGPVLTHLIASTGRVVRHSIPGWAQALRKRQALERRRRPGRRARV